MYCIRVVSGVNVGITPIGVSYAMSNRSFAAQLHISPPIRASNRQAQTLHIKSALQGSDEHLPSSASEAHTSVVALADFCEVGQRMTRDRRTG